MLSVYLKFFRGGEGQGFFLADLIHKTLIRQSGASAPLVPSRAPSSGQLLVVDKKSEIGTPLTVKVSYHFGDVTVFLVLHFMRRGSNRNTVGFRPLSFNLL